MTTSMSPHDPDVILAAWLEEGPNQLPEPTRRAIAVATRTARQTRRAFGMHWRPDQMNPFARLAFTAAAIVVVAGAAVFLSTPGGPLVGGPGPTLAGPSITLPSVTPSSNPAPSASLQAPAATPGVFSSARYGYTLVFLGGPILNLPSEQDWPAGLVPDPGSKFLDRFNAQFDAVFEHSATTYFTGIAAQALLEGMSAEDWMLEYIQRNWAIRGDSCGGRPEDWVATSVAGVTGRQVQTDCGGGPASMTEIVFATEETGWIMIGDTRLVEVLRASFQLPG